MSPDNVVGKGPDQERVLDLPQICGLVPDRWSNQLVIYGGEQNYLDGYDGKIRSSLKAGKLRLSPTKPLFGNAEGWEVAVAPLERGGQIGATYGKTRRGSEETVFCNVWEWDSNGNLSLLRIIRGISVALYFEPVAVIPVPEKPHAKLSEEKGGVIIVSLVKLRETRTQRILKEFLEPRFQGR